MAKPSLSRERIESSSLVYLRQERAVRFQEVDAAGTVFMPRLFEYMADAYLELLARSGIDTAARMATGKWAVPYVHAEADFVGPLRFGDSVVVEITVAELGKSSVTFGFRMTKLGGGLTAIGQTSHVFVDNLTFRPSSVPEELRSFVASIG